MGIREFFISPKPGIKESGIGLVSRGGQRVTSGDSDDEDPVKENMEMYRNSYLNFPVVTGSIDITSDQTVQDFFFEGSNSGKLMEWADKINLGEKFLQICKSMLIFGIAYVEMPNKTSFKILDSRFMTIYREKTGNIIGCSQQIEDFGDNKVLWGTTGNKGKDSKFKKKSKLENMILFPYNNLPGDKYGTSIIHAVLSLLSIKDQIEGDIKQIVRRYAAPIIHAKIGDETHPPSDSDLTSVKSELTDIYTDTEYVTNWLTDLSVLGFEGKAMNIEYIMNHIDANIIAGLQVPPELLGLGASSKSESEVKLRSFGRHVKSIQRTIKNTFEDKVIVGKSLGGIKDKLIWGAAEEREREIDFDILRGLVKDGLVTREKANSLLPPEFHDKEVKNLDPEKMFGQNRDMGGNQNRDPFNKGADKEKDNPNDPNLKIDDEERRRNKTDRAEKKKDASI